MIHDIDLSERKWSTIPKKFEGSIEGIHKVVITLAEGDTFAYYDALGTACASFLKKTADAIRQTTEGEVVVDTRLWTCLDKQVTDALMERRDVALTINYTYQGKRYTVTIPAGTDASALLDENGYCGFRYLDLLYHGSALEE